MSLLQPLSGPSSFFVALHGPLSSLFQPLGVPARINLLPPLTDTLAPFVEIFSPCPTFGGSLLSLLQPLSGPSSFFVALRGYLFFPSWSSYPFVDPLHGNLFSLRLSWPFTDPFRVFSNPLESLRGLSPLTDTLAPFVEIFSPCPTFGGSLLSLLQPLSGPSSFVALRGYLFSFVLFVGPLRGYLFPLHCLSV